MVRPSRRDFLGGSALTLAALTGTLDPDRVADSTTPTDRRSLDELPDSAASAIAALPDDDSLDLSYRLVVTTDVADADVAEDLSHEARVVTRELDVAAADLSTVVTAITHDYRRRITVAAGSIDRLDRGEEVATVGDWRVADDGDREGMTTVSTDGVAAFVAGEDRSGRVEAARAIATAAAGEADGEAADRLVDANADADAAFGLVESFDTVLFAPDAAESGFQTPGASAVGTGAIRAFAGGFEIHPARLHGSDDRAENRYLFFTDDPSTPGDRAVRSLIEAIGTGIVEEATIDRSGETIRVDAVLEAPPEHDHENAPDVRVGTTVAGEADGTSGDGEADGTGSGQETGGVTLEHRGGETVTGDALEALQLWVDGELVDRQPADRLDRFEPGDTLTVETDPLASVVLRWFDAERNAHRVYANEAIGAEAFAIDHDVEAETVTITYVGDREADAGKVAVTHRSDDGTVRTPAPSFGDGGGGTADGSDALTNGDAVTIEDVGMGDVVSLTLTVPSIPGVHRRPLQRFRVTPPRIHVHDHPDRGLIAAYHGEEDYDASAFRVLVDGEPADRQIADEIETLSRGAEIPLGEYPVDSTVTIEWLDPEEPVVVAEHEVVPEAFVDLEYDPEAGTVRVEHREGDAMAADRVKIRADGEPLGTQPADEYEEFGPGDSLAAEVPPFARVEVVWVGADDDAESGTDDDAAGGRDERDHHLAGTTTAREALKAHYDPGAAEMRLTYVGAQPADPEGLQVTTYSPADDSSDRTSGRPSGGERETLVVAEEYDELTSGDTITLTDVEIGDRVTVSIRTETANMVSERSVGHYPTEPRHGFTFQPGSELEAGTGADGRETGTGTDQREAVPDDGIAAVYRDPVSRDAAEFRLLVDDEPADTQPADEHDVLERGDVISLGEFEPGTTFAAEWTPPAEPVEAGSHVIAPTADFAVDYDAADGSVTVTHDGGGAIAAEHLSVVVTPDPGRPEPWSGDEADGSIDEGDSTTVEVGQDPHRAFVLFREHEVIAEKRLAENETNETRDEGGETDEARTTETGTAKAEASASGSAESAAEASGGASDGSSAESSAGAEAAADAEAE
ncbi:hypothetical protein [Halopenitus persicus]|uniref:Uncharacterized protein n=1 Tax=Halopenitus persicus TaxID=1048396 RepID=A0A1H3G5P0_9EURY|nr:hypothetical protein [Halopenitus persicus]SDX97669.1 hypothetical protein SAMN05216564_102316 [Halopenitus persicus]